MIKRTLLAVTLLWLLNGVVFASVGRESSLQGDSAMTICFAGDLMLDRGVRTVIRGEGIGHLFDAIAPVLRAADFAVINLECPATASVQPLRKKYIFRAEPEWLKGVRDAGITHVSLANNHSNDQGRAGVETTARNATKYRLHVVGYGRTQREARRPALMIKGRDTVAVFASVMIPLENWMYRADLPGPSQASAAELAEDIAAWKERHPHSVVMAFPHWGWEYRATPNEQQRIDAAMLIRAGADAVIGHHPHVVQTIESIDGRPVFYSVGNFVFDSRRDAGRNGLVVKCTVARGSIIAVQLIPFAISRCAPVPLKNGAAEWFDTYVRPSSPEISLEQQDGDWILRNASASSHVNKK